MWRQRMLERASHWTESFERDRHSMLTRGRLLSDTLRPSPPLSPHHLTHHSHHHQHPSPPDAHAYLREEEEERGGDTEGYWTRRLLKQEEKDPSR